MYILFEQGNQPRFAQCVATVYNHKHSAMAHVKEMQVMFNEYNYSYVWRLHDGTEYCDGSENVNEVQFTNIKFGGICE